MLDIFQQVGFKDTSEKEVAGKLKCSAADVYWTMMTEVAAPFVAALSKADESTKEKIKEEVFHAINQKYPDGNVTLEASALVIFGQK